MSSAIGLNAMSSCGCESSGDAVWTTLSAGAVGSPISLVQPIAPKDAIKIQLKEVPFCMLGR
jgi:hypothetical protein